MIGYFTVGEASIGQSVENVPFVPSDNHFDWRDTLLSQYANSPVIIQLLENFSSYLDPTDFLDDFFSKVWNVFTAVGYGLDVLGRIVGVSRVLRLPAGSYLGFSEANGAQSFGQAPFYDGQNLTTNYALTDMAYRKLILAKAAANITDGSTRSINAILMALFPEYGNSYVEDHGDMTMSYHFGASLSLVDYAIVAQSGVLPKPAGVSVTIVQGS